MENKLRAVVRPDLNLRMELVTGKEVHEFEAE
jgi:hypothetical protein